ncbi:recombination regulator RecX [Salipaludibacillus keqinensis]|uniref:Regulatory protein RecX n=1 Tax=Salipaludibacillus keqinensis TaxID=2045207 RepID=A0A323TCK2_9BACI|nr:recombination regulator RecX [Salipaludibacillus keqinensis]PYZ92406.1 recombination regulator RecX [Salipaludibacillus keqinensis]
MPVITKITAAKKTKGRYHIYLKRGEGEEYAFSVSEDVLVSEHLTKGKELTKTDISNLKDKDDVDKAMQKVLNYLSYRMRSETEVIRYLKDLEVAEEDITRMVKRLRELDFIDDQRFCEAFVRTKRDTAKKGPLLIEQELYQKGVSKINIEQAMKQYSEELQLEHATAMVEKKQSSYKKESLKKKQQKLMQFIIQRGYPHSIASKAVQLAEIEEDPELEWDAVDKQGEKAWRKYEKKELWERKQRVKQYLYGRGFTADKIDEWIEHKLESDE